MATVDDVRTKLASPATYQHYLLSLNFAALVDRFGRPDPDATRRARRLMLRAFALRFNCGIDTEGAPLVTEAPYAENGFGDWHRVAIYDLGDNSLVLVLDVTPLSAIGVIADIKLACVRLLAEAFGRTGLGLRPDALFEVVNVRTHRPQANRLLDRIEAQLARRPRLVATAAPGRARAADGTPATADRVRRTMMPDLRSDIMVARRSPAEVDAALTALTLDGFFKIFVRVQPIALLADGDAAGADADAPEVIATELYCQLPKIEQFLLAEPGTLDDPNRRAAVTRVLDRHMLNALAGAPRLFDRPLAVNLNLASLATPEFAAFAAAMRDHLPKLVLEIAGTDAERQPEAFAQLRRFADQTRATLCLDGLDPALVDVEAVTALKPAMVKLIAPSPDAIDPDALAAKVAALESAGIVVAMTRIGDAAQLDLARGCDIRVVEGHWVDRMIAEHGTGETDPAATLVARMQEKIDYLERLLPYRDRLVPERIDHHIADGLRAVRRHVDRLRDHDGTATGVGDHLVGLEGRMQRLQTAIAA